MTVIVLTMSSMTMSLWLWAWDILCFCWVKINEERLVLLMEWKFGERENKQFFCIIVLFVCLLQKTKGSTEKEESEEE